MLKTTKLLVIGLLAACMCLSMSTGYLWATLTVQKQLPSTLAVSNGVNLSLYPDDSSTTQLATIDWGIMQPSQTRQYELWIENDASISINITLTTKNWNVDPTAAGLSFSYDQNGNWATTYPLAGNYPVLYSGRRASVLLTLSVSANATAQAVSFTVVVQGDAVTP